MVSAVRIIRNCIKTLGRRIIGPTSHVQRGGTESEDKMDRNTIKVLLASLNKGKTGKVVLRGHSPKLYYDFMGNAGRIERTTDLEATPQNCVKARDLLDTAIAQIADGSFKFEEWYPTASASKKFFHAQSNAMAATRVKPSDLTIGEYITDPNEGWLATILPVFKDSVQNQYRADIEYWILPLFGDLKFSELSGDKLHGMFVNFRVRRVGDPLEAKRICNILIPFERVWESAESKFGWSGIFPNPFQYLVEKNLKPVPVKKLVEILRVEEWKKIYALLPTYYQRVALLLLLTGMIESEITGLKKDKVEFHDEGTGKQSFMEVVYKISEKAEGPDLKAPGRNRQIRITHNLRAVLEPLYNASPDEFVLTQPDGTRYQHYKFTTAWKKAMMLAGVKYSRPYVLRHCFAGWAQALGMPPNQVRFLMGHGSLELLTTTYGRHKLGLENDKAEIRKIFGADFF